MDILARSDIQELVGHRGGPHVSIYMPAFRTGRETQQNGIRFKNLVRRVEEALRELGQREESLGAVLGEARELVSDSDFWQHQSDGLAYFAAEGVTRAVRVPLNVPELAIVTDRFHIKPLLSLISNDGRFYLLVLDLNRTHLFQGTRHSIGEIELTGVPAGMEEALRYDDPEQHLQFHTGAASPAGRRAAMFHGQGTGTDEGDRKKNILRFFQQLDRGIRRLLSDHNVPLVVAGVDYLIPLYREASSYGRLLPAAVPGNADGLSEQELHAAAWEIVLPYVARTQEQAAEKYARLSGTDRTSRSIEEVVRQAGYQRVESIFIPAGRQVWGSTRGDDVRLHPERSAGDEDLLDLAAVRTFLTGGDVYVVPEERMPAPSDVAAVYRY